jgi:hypothetical protein
MGRHIDYNDDYDGRPPVGDDELLRRLLTVHGQEYADELLRKDAALRAEEKAQKRAAMRKAAEQAAA